MGGESDKIKCMVKVVQRQMREKEKLTDKRQTETEIGSVLEDGGRTLQGKIGRGKGEKERKREIDNICIYIYKERGEKR